MEPLQSSTIGTKDFVFYCRVSLAQGLVIDQSPPAVVANHDKATIGDEKDCIEIYRFLALRQESGDNLGNTATAGR